MADPRGTNSHTDKQKNAPPGRFLLVSIKIPTDLPFQGPAPPPFFQEFLDLPLHWRICL